MGTVRSLFKEKAVAMRLQGHSYNDILKTLNLTSKGTLSFWLRDLKLPKEARLNLKKHSAIVSRQNFRKFNEARSTRIQKENDDAYDFGRGRIGDLTNRELMLIGSSLYWGEGTKSAGNGGSPVLAFTNSDPLLIAVYLRFVRQVLEIPDIQIRGGIHLYPNTDVQKARRYWARVTILPPDRFYIITMISRLSAGKRNPRLLPYGTLTLRVHKRRIFHHVRGMMRGLFEAKIKPERARGVQA